MRRRMIVATAVGSLVATCAGMYRWHPFVAALTGVATLLAMAYGYDLFDRRGPR